MRRYLTVVALLIAMVTAAFAAPESSAGRSDVIPASSEFPNLVGVERQVAFEVSKYKAPDGKRWIRLYSEYESVYRANMEDVIATLWDFEESPKIFSRILATHLRSNTGTVAVIEQKTGIRVLGFGYTSNLVFKDVLRRDEPGSVVLEFEAIEVDKTTLSSRGSWILMEGRDESGPLTYARYTLDSYVEPKYPAQEWIMRQFGDGDMKRVIRELYKATVRRAQGG
jgi:hypothetical protein